MNKMIVIRKDFKVDNPVDHAMLSYLKDISKLLRDQNYVFCINDVFYNLEDVFMSCEEIHSYNSTKDFKLDIFNKRFTYKLEMTFIKR